MFSTAISTFFIWILTCLVLFNKERWNGFYKSPVFWVFVLSFMYLIGSSIYGSILFPNTQKLQFKEATKWFKLWMFLSVGIVINQKEDRALNVLKIAFISFLISIAIYLIKNYEVLFHKIRSGFGHKAIPFGLYADTAILGLIIFIRNFISKKDKIKLIIYIILLIFLFELLSINRSKGPWLALTIVFPFVIYLCYFKEEYTKYVIIIFLLIISMIILNFNIIKSRIQPILEFILKQNVAESNIRSITDRYYLFKLGLNKFLEKPLIGWGAGPSRLLIEKSDKRFIWLKHLHNFYLEVLVRFGIIGFILMTVLIFVLIFRLYKARRRKIISRNIFIFLVGSIGLISIYNLTNFSPLHPDFRFYWAIIGGVIYGLGVGHNNIEDTAQ